MSNEPILIEEYNLISVFPFLIWEDVLGACVHFNGLSLSILFLSLFNVMILFITVDDSFPTRC